MNEATRQHIEDLKKAGFPVGELEKAINSNPILDKKADQIIGGGILRQQAFTRITQQRADEVKKLENQIAQLQGMKNAGAGEDSQLYKAALEVIQEQEQLLIDAGFSEDEVKALTEKATRKAEEQPTKQAQPPAKKENIEDEEGDDMSKVDTSNLVDLDTFQKQMENSIFGGATLAAKIQTKVNEATRLGVEIPSEKIDNLGLNLRNAIGEGKNIDQFLDEDLGIKAARETKAAADRQKEIDDARAAGYAEGQKESGVPRRIVSKTQKHPIYDNIQPHQVETKTEQSEDKEVPKNKYGDSEVFRTRGDRNSRIAAGAAYHEKVLARVDQLSGIPNSE